MTTNLRRTFSFAALAALTALAAGLPSPARAATDNRLRVELLVDGAPVREYRSQGTTYVEARRGREYSVRLTNLEPVRVAVALAVDGRNTIDGARSSAKDARKWILEPWQTITVKGWQVDGSRARRFYFTTEDRSYAEWLGDTRNVGVIEAVAFRERQWRHDDDDDRWNSSRDEDEQGSYGRDQRKDGGPAREKSAGSGMPAPAEAPSASAKSRGASQESSRTEARSAAKSDDNAATGIGRDVRHDVVRVDFDQESWASSQVRVRYEFRERLVDMGIIQRDYDEDDHYGWHRRERASGFDDGAYCPEPRRW